MKLGTFVMMILVVALALAMYGYAIADMQTAYPEVQVNTSSWSGSYDYISEINESTSAIKEDFRKIGDSQTWFGGALTGLVAIPSAVINAVKLILDSISYGNSILTGVLTDVLHVPPAIIYIMEVGLLVVVIFALISFWQRHPA